jgi:hypothetical protein
MGNKTLQEMRDPDAIIQNDPNLSSKRKQGVTQGFMNDNTVSWGLRKNNDGTDQVI